MVTPLRLGLNIDHVATLRNARGETHPSVLQAAKLAESTGVDGITVHLREDRRHIRDHDVYDIKEHVNIPLNLEMAATDEMVKIACDVKPAYCCIVPEKREELTTEGGLDVIAAQSRMRDITQALHENNIKTSLFIDPNPAQLDASVKAGAYCVELHTGTYANGAEGELQRLIEAAAYGHGLGLKMHAGHGLTFHNVGPIAAISEVEELNIGHFLMGEALFVGLPEAIRHMRKAMDKARM